MAYYDAISTLPIEVDSYRLAGHEQDVSSGFLRVSTEIVVTGGGHEGRGEDVTYSEADQRILQAAPPDLPLKFKGSFGEFSDLLGRLDTFPQPPEDEVYRSYRRWGFESAALDLALRQADTSLDRLLSLTYQPVRFVVSLRLGDPPDANRVHDWLAASPGLEFKLDAQSSWSRELMEELAATGAVESVDLKGMYKGSVVDQGADPRLYRDVAGVFDQAWIEDPALTPETIEALGPGIERITWDAIIHSVEDIASLDTVPKSLNIKPSRFGPISAVLAGIEHCQSAGIAMYSGGQFELSVGREQLHALASLFYPDGPNDLAPIEYNRPEPTPGLPGSPLQPPTRPEGFRWRFG